MIPALDYETRGSAAVIALPGHADADTIRALGLRIQEALAGGHPWIAVDLSAVAHMSTQTLSELCAVLRRARNASPSLTVAGADMRIQWVLGLCEIGGLELDATIEDALARRPAPASGESTADVTLSPDASMRPSSAQP